MGKTLIILTVVLGTVFSAVLINVQKNARHLPDMITYEVVNSELDNIGRYALSHGIKYFKDHYSSGNSFSYGNWHEINMQRNLGKINSITYTKDSSGNWLVSATVSKVVNGHTISKTFTAKLSYSFQKPASEFHGYNFDQISGNKLIDESGNGYDATIHNLSFESGRFGSAVKSDHIWEYANTDNSPNHEYNPQMQFTIATWVKLDFPSGGWLGSWTTTSSNIVSNINPNNLRPSYTLYVVATRIRFLWWWISKKLRWVFAISHGRHPQFVDKTERFGNSENMETWHYVVASYDGQYSSNRAKISIWVKNIANGKIYSAYKIVKKMTAVPNNNITYIGSAPNEVVTGLWSFIRALINMFGNIFNPTGNIMDELGLYHELLTPQQINQLITQNGVQELRLEDWYDASPIQQGSWNDMMHNSYGGH